MNKDLSMAVAIAHICVRKVWFCASHTPITVILVYATTPAWIQ